jgi:hypothetical protein
MLPAKDAQREIAVVAIVAVKETSFSLAVQQRIGGVQIEHHLGGSSAWVSKKISITSASMGSAE